MRDDKSSSRGEDGSPSGPDGLGIPSRSAPASSSPPPGSREELISHLEFALRAFEDDENEGWWLNMALLAVEGGIQAWRAETPLERPPGPPLGRPKVVDDDAQKLLDLRAAKPGSNCRTDFERWTGAGQQRARIRYQDADARVAELLALMTPASGKSS
jgi:hypothetical protein